MKIVIVSDHAGYDLKEKIIEKFNNIINFTDLGTNSSVSVDYPDFAHKAAMKMQDKDYLFAILICGSGNGIQMTANKHQNIRCALCWNKEIAELARAHNDANALALPARYLNFSDAFNIINAFINTPFEGGRHNRRKEKISCV